MALQPIPQGTFVCEYAGEYVTYKVAQQRLAQYDQQTGSPGHALLVSKVPACKWNLKHACRNTTARTQQILTAAAASLLSRAWQQRCAA
jgi:hypothetical protein